MMETGHSWSQSTEEATKIQRGDTPSTSGQPPSRGCGFDDVIIKLAKALSNDSDVWTLGLLLGVKNRDINRALETNWAGGVKTSNGNEIMLQNWAMTVTSSKQLPTLRAALKKAGLLEVEETCLPSSPTGDHGAMPDAILKLRKQLKSRYRKKYRMVNTSPVDPESRTWLQHVYVNLILMMGLRGAREEPIDYEGLFKFIKTETPKGFVTRLSFIGEAGVGKSTLFAKIALDWAEGKILQEIDLLFLESFREIEESKYFGDSVMNHFPDDTDIKGEEVDDYIRKNRRKVLLLLDGLDEARIDIKKSNLNNAVVSIVRGERFVDTPVFITTRPFGADQIKSVERIRDQYTFIQVTGFTPENMSKYIKQFFEEDRDSASSLLQLVKLNDVVAEHMAPIPIFCCMLCYMWKAPSRRETLLKVRTLLQLLELLVFSLQEHYCSKHGDSEGGYEVHRKKVAESLKEAGRVAFHGLLVKQYIFDENAIGSEAGMIACGVGVLSREKRLAPMKIRESQGKQFIHEYSFPHKLLQEYTSSLYLASLFLDDRPEFNKILVDKLLKDYKEFQYVLYFTAARGGEVGKSLMEALCQRVDDLDFIMQVAFECHDTGATIKPVRNLLNMKSHLELKHPFTAYFFTLETLGKEVMRKESSIVQPSGKAMSSSSHVHAAALGLFTLQNLRSLKIWGLNEEDFFKGMWAAASQSKIEELTLTDMDLGPAASSHYARGVFSMPHLRSLRLDSVWLSDEFYSVMAEEASKSKIEELTQTHAYPSCAASSHYARGVFSMPHLRSLRLDSVWLSDEFYSVMAEEASKSKIEELTLTDMDLGPAASSHYARGVFSMPHLRSLRLDSVWLSDEFYSVMAEEASKSKIEELTLTDMHPGPAASSQYARGVFSMPYLRSLRLDSVRLSDEFYSVMAEEASKSKIEELTQTHMNPGRAASSHYARGVFSMPHLRSLRLDSVWLSDEFYSVMAEEASKSKIEELTQTHMNPGPAASSHYARGIFSMPHLRSPRLDSVLLRDEFYSVMAEEASKSKIEELTQTHMNPGPAASSHYARGIFSMPHLRSLRLDSVWLSDEFYSVMAEEASKSKIEELTQTNIYMDLGPAASSHYARGVFTMPHLRSLRLDSVWLSDEFYSVMAEDASKSKIKSLRVASCPDSAQASHDFALALCTLPDLTELTLDSMYHLHDNFYSTWRTMASSMKVCFPQVSKGNFRFNGAHQENLDSLLCSLTAYQRSQPKKMTSQPSDPSQQQPMLKVDSSYQVHPTRWTSQPSGHDQTSPNPARDWTWVSDDVDSHGKELTIPLYGFILSIPPGALEDGSSEWITCEALPSLPNDFKLNSGELIVSPGFQCYPSGLHFKKPVKLIIPHCGVFNYPAKVRTVLISTVSQKTGEVLRTPLTQDACTVTHSYFELSLLHFSGGHVVPLYDLLAVKGKHMLCMSYLPKIMPPSRKPLMEFRLSNKPYDPALREARTDIISQPVKDEEDEIFVKYKDLEVNCQLDEDEPDRQQSKKISYGFLFSKDKHQEYFKLDLNDKANDTTVTLQLLQDKKDRPQEIMFQTRFTGYAPSAVDPEEQSNPPSCSTSTTRPRKRPAPCTQSAVTDSISGIPEKGLRSGPPLNQVQLSRTPPDYHQTSPILTPGAASSTIELENQSKQPRMSSVAETDFDNVLKEITKKIPAGKIDDLGKALGFEYTEIENFIATNTTDGTLKMLREWREKQSNPDHEKAALRKCLKDAGLNRLANLPILQDGQHSGGQVTEQHHQTTAASFSVGIPAASSAASSRRQQVPVANTSTTAPDDQSTNTLGRIVTDEELLKLASSLPKDYYLPVAIHLGLVYTDYDNIRRQNELLRDRNFEMLMKWKIKQNGGKVEDLDKALNEAGCGQISYLVNAQ